MRLDGADEGFEVGAWEVGSGAGVGDIVSLVVGFVSGVTVTGAVICAGAVVVGLDVVGRGRREGLAVGSPSNTRSDTDKGFVGMSVSASPGALVFSFVFIGEMVGYCCWKGQAKPGTLVTSNEGSIVSLAFCRIEVEVDAEGVLSFRSTVADRTPLRIVMNPNKTKVMNRQRSRDRLLQL